MYYSAEEQRTKERRRTVSLLVLVLWKFEIRKKKKLKAHKFFLFYIVSLMDRYEFGTPPQLGGLLACLGGEIIVNQRPPPFLCRSVHKKSNNMDP